MIEREAGHELAQWSRASDVSFVKSRAPRRGRARKGW